MKGKRYILLLMMGLGFYFALPSRLFDVPYSTVIYDRDSLLLGAHIAADGQWRFPASERRSFKYETALRLYEDEYFDVHPGVNPLAIGRATLQNIRAGRVVSGGSTLSMQVVRMATNHPRTIPYKLLEILQSLRLELRYSKQEILRLYQTHAPYGGNVVGIEGASWRYFQRNIQQLSWAESALLAVLPNAPGLIHTGKNRAILLRKRNRLLVKLRDHGLMDSVSCRLAMDEPIPAHPHALPRLAPHLLELCRKQGEGQVHYLHLQKNVQAKINEVVRWHHDQLKRSEIQNIGAIVLNVQTNEVMAYAGNIEGAPHEHVDMIQARRSTGSILKPFLYAAALADGQIMPQALVADVPRYYKNFTPKNYSKTFDGAVPADEALSRSLNIPAVDMLKDYGVGKFHADLQQLGMSTLEQPAAHYGLSLVLGGAEVKLFDLVGMYAGMMRKMDYFSRHSSQYPAEQFPAPYIFRQQQLPLPANTQQSAILTAGAIYHTFEAMKNVRRPAEESGWEQFTTHQQIAWKTGTSYGLRDAWAVGVTADYVVGVWVGNANGEGRSGIVGGLVAAPVLFDIFRGLKVDRHWQVPYGDLSEMRVCSQSGFKPNPYCPSVTKLVNLAGARTEICPYHVKVHLDEEEQYRVSSACYPTYKMKHQSWFVLPHVMEWYYQQTHALYRKLPAWKNTCLPDGQQPMAFIYPQKNRRLWMPKDLDGNYQQVVCKVVHQYPSKKIFWHLDDQFLGTTNGVHELAIAPMSGRHLLQLVDEDGHKIQQYIEVASR